YGIDAWTKLPRARREGLRRADFVVAISEYTKQRAIEANGVPAERFHVLPNALEHSAQKFALELSQIPPPSGMRLLSVCRLDAAEQYKGVDTVIESLPAIAAQVPDVQYLIVGGGTDVERHQQLARNAGVAERVHFLGFVDDAKLRAYYQACDVFVMPSAGEGFGFVYLEAMEYSKPVVAARSGGAPEVVEDGVTGTLVEYGDVRQLAETLVRLCGDSELRTRFGRAGYNRLHERFTYPQFRQTLTDILRDELQPAASHDARRRNLLNSVRSAGGRRLL
ncbi:MAG: glycosyltransferase family 4 protein, partial [Acidobacteriota bacterium]|nr:glycosyltransferase family 4 protein [Acidobacteriota bacterium]